MDPDVAGSNPVAPQGSPMQIGVGLFIFKELRQIDGQTSNGGGKRLG
jgi:hypothetical protein